MEVKKQLRKIGILSLALAIALSNVPMSQAYATESLIVESTETEVEQSVSGGDAAEKQINEVVLINQVITKAVDSNEVSISGNIPEGAEIEVAKITDCDGIKSQIESFLNNGSTVNVYEAFDFKIMVDGEKYQPTDFDESVVVTVNGIGNFELGENENLVILHILDDGTIEQVSGSVENGVWQFNANSFSNYVIAGIEHPVMNVDDGIESYTFILDEHMHWVDDVEACGYYTDIDHSRLDTVNDYWVCGTDANGREFTKVYYKVGNTPSILYGPLNDSYALSYDDGYTFEGIYESENADRRVLVSAVDGKIYYARAVTNSVLVYFKTPYTSSIFTNLDEWYEKLKNTAGDWTTSHYAGLGSIGNIYNYSYNDSDVYNNRTVIFNTSKDTVIYFNDLPTVEVSDANYKFVGYLVQGVYDYTNKTGETLYQYAHCYTSEQILTAGESVRLSDINANTVNKDISYERIEVRPLIVPVNIEVQYYDTYNSAGVKELTLLDTQYYTLDNFESTFDSSSVNVPIITGSALTENAWWLMDLGNSDHLGYITEVEKDNFMTQLPAPNAVIKTPVYENGAIVMKEVSVDTSIVYSNPTRNYDSTLQKYMYADAYKYSTPQDSGIAIDVMVDKLVIKLINNRNIPKSKVTLHSKNAYGSDVTQSLTINGAYSIKEVHGDIEPASRTIENSSDVFCYWSLDGSTKYDMNTVVIGNIDLYAVYKPQYEVKFYTSYYDFVSTKFVEGKSVKDTDSNGVYFYNNNFSDMSVYAATNEHEFVGWGTRNGDKTSIIDIDSYEVTGNISLYALWNKYYSITFNTDGGTPVPANQRIVAGEKVVEPTEPTKAGYKFVGWFNGSDEWDFSKKVYSSYELTAKWEEQPVYYTVTFDANGGNYTPASQTINKNGLVSEPTTPTKDNYEFGGWYTPTHIKWDFENDVVTENITLTAKWIETYNVYFNVGGGIPKPDDQVILKGDKVTKPVEPVRDGYEFVGWQSQRGDLWDFDNTLPNDTIYEKDLYLSAVWKKLYTVSFDTDGGTPVPEIQKRTYGSKVVEPTEPTKSDYKFIGWFSGDSEWDFSTDVVKGNTEFVAKWEKVDTHVHTFSTDWFTDETNHWHAATCGHDLKADEAEHIASDWIIDVEATEEVAGSKHKECTVCEKILATEIIPKLTKPEPTPTPTPEPEVETEDEEDEHEHTFSDIWSHDIGSHWHAATCGHDVTTANGGHEESGWIVDKQATTEEDGSKHTECLVCGRVIRTDIIPMIVPNIIPVKPDPTPEPTPEPEIKPTPEPADTPEPEYIPVIEEEEPLYVGTIEDEDETMKGAMARFMEAVKTMAIVISISLAAILGILGLLLLLLAFLRRVKVQNDKNVDEYAEAKYETVYKTSVSSEGNKVAELFRKSDRVWTLTIPEKMVADRVTDDFKVVLKKAFCNWYHGEQIIVVIQSEVEVDTKELGFVIDKEENEIKFNINSL